MATGYLYNQICFPTLAEATAAKWQNQPAGVTAGTASYITNFDYSGTVWQIKRYTLSSTGTLTLNTTTSAPVLTFPACDTFTNFNDGLTLGWGVVAAMVAAYAFTLMRKGLINR